MTNTNIREISGREIASVVGSLAAAAARVVYPERSFGSHEDRARFSSDFHMAFFSGDSDRRDMLKYAETRLVGRDRKLSREDKGLLVTLGVAIDELYDVWGE